MYKNESFVIGIILLVLSFAVAGWGLYQHNTVYASPTSLTGMPISENYESPYLSQTAPFLRSEEQTPLTTNEKAGLEYALLYEYGTMNLYRSLAEQFESSRLFVQILTDEQEYISLLMREAEKFDLSISIDLKQTYSSTVSNIEEACLTVVNSEGTKRAIYEDLSAATFNPGLIRVYSYIQHISQTRHLQILYQCE